MYTSRVVHIRKYWTKSFPALSFWYLDLLLDSKVSIIIFLNHLLLLLFYLINFYKSYHAAPPPTFKNFEIFHSFHLESTPNFKIKSLKNPKFDTLSKLQNTCTCTHYVVLGSHSQITRLSKQPSQGFISQKFLEESWVAASSNGRGHLQSGF